MAKIQTRRSISVRGHTYGCFRAWCERLGVSMSERLELLITRDLGSGATPAEATAKHAAPASAPSGAPQQSAIASQQQLSKAEQGARSGADRVRDDLREGKGRGAQCRDGGAAATTARPPTQPRLLDASRPALEGVHNVRGAKPVVLRSPSLSSLPMVAPTPAPVQSPDVGRRAPVPGAPQNTLQMARESIRQEVAEASARVAAVRPVRHLSPDEYEAAQRQPARMEQDPPRKARPLVAARPIPNLRSF